MIFHPAQTGHHAQNEESNERFGLGEDGRIAAHGAFQDFGGEIIAEIAEGGE